MKIICLFSFLLIFSFCSTRSAETDVENILGAKDSSAFAMQDTEIDYELVADSEYALFYIVSVCEGYNYDSLRSIAKSSSAFLNFKFDTLDRYYNPVRKKIVLPTNHTDEIWAGEYFFRRHGDSTVSLEMRSAYVDTLLAKDEKRRDKFHSDTLKMFVFADLSANLEDATRTVKLLKPNYPQTKIIATEIFMGCMH